MVTRSQIIHELEKCTDPEIGVSIVDLGLINDIKISGHQVHVSLSVTTPNCPFQFYIVQDIHRRIVEMDGVDVAEVELDGKWTPDQMSEKAREKLGFDNGCGVSSSH